MTSGPTLLQTNGTISEQEYISCVTGIQGLCPGIGPHIGQEGYQHLGLRLVNSIIDDISYQYMYGLNVVFLKA